MLFVDNLVSQSRKKIYLPIFNSQYVSVFFLLGKIPLKTNLLGSASVVVVAVITVIISSILVQTQREHFQ